jgi:hypothetical protein
MSCEHKRLDSYGTNCDECHISARSVVEVLHGRNAAEYERGRQDELKCQVDALASKVRDLGIDIGRGLDAPTVSEEQAYERGRVAGLEEAAKRVEANAYSDDERARLGGQWPMACEAMCRAAVDIRATKQNPQSGVLFCDEHGGALPPANAKPPKCARCGGAREISVPDHTPDGPSRRIVQCPDCCKPAKP